LVNKEVVLVDTTIENVEVLLKGLKDNTDLIRLNSEGNIESAFLSVLTKRYERVHFLAHGVPGKVVYKCGYIDTNFVENLPNIGYQGLSLFIWSCHVGLGDVGSSFVNLLASKLNAKVYASSSALGNNGIRSNWFLDVKSEIN
jgi:hypothetical protein